ncbi:MAG TPA: hypothetical protein VLV83_13150 [Acidobacteriota bacterium]|nr:hypothetical protein [Acidobacteriota bacterium]
MMRRLTTLVLTVLLLGSFASAQLRRDQEEAPHPGALLGRAIPLEADRETLDPETGEVLFRLVNDCDQEMTAWTLQYTTFFENGLMSSTYHTIDFAMASAKNFPEGRGPLLPGEVREMRIRVPSEYEGAHANQVDVVVLAAVALSPDAGSTGYGNLEYLMMIQHGRKTRDFVRRYWRQQFRELVWKSLDEKALEARVQLMIQELKESSSQYGEGALSSEDGMAPVEERQIAELLERAIATSGEASLYSVLQQCSNDLAARESEDSPHLEIRPIAARRH